MATMPRARSTPRVKKPAPPTEATPMIGEEGSGGYVSCPKCGRPVADGLVRCSGCGTRILLGVGASRALLFLTTGAVLGLLVGGLSVGSILNASRAPAPAAAPAGAVHPASPSPVASAATPVPSLRSTVDPLAASALRQVASTNLQLAMSLDNLKHELKARAIDTGAIAATLRAISASATYGTSVVGYLSAWPEAAALQGQLGQFYTQVRAVAANGLASLLASLPAYQSAGNQMVAVLAGLPAIQTAEQVLGGGGGVILPGASSPAVLPSPSPAPSN